MLISVARVTILYILILAAMRLMGKRQVGELQPSELAATVLISDIAAIPMQDNDLPIINSVTAVLIIACYEIFSSVISMKSFGYRRMLQGNPVIVIRQGKPDQAKMKALRLTASDLMASLRKNGVFDIDDVEYAVLETDGKLSIMKKADCEPPTAGDMNFKPPLKGIPIVLICDGSLDSDGVREAGLNTGEVEKLLRREKKNKKDIILMTIDSLGKLNIITKEKA